MRTYVAYDRHKQIVRGNFWATLCSTSNLGQLSFKEACLQDSL